ncbi:MAG: YvcK family protein [Chloroflexi bacterium]|nr:YvcK family protein [Chloroflexota bacterium]
MNNGYLNGNGNNASRWSSIRRLLRWGVGVKRWLVLGSLGVGILALGFAYLLVKVFSVRPSSGFPASIEAIAGMAVGFGLIGISLYGLYRSLGPVLFANTSLEKFSRTLSTRRSRVRGPKVVAIGGGTGLSVLLRGLKVHTDNLSAIVTVADDGGSSGRLRKELGLLPPGDFRNCIVAMSDTEDLMTNLFQYRFKQGDLEGHSFGNLFIAAMTDVTGSFVDALHESSQVLAVKGQILPSTLTDMHLAARMKDGTVIRGESSITKAGGEIDTLFTEPAEPVAYPYAVEAIREADIIVIGPGSLYTSIMPNLLVPGIQEAIKSANATKMYVCNVATQVGETDGFTVFEHVEALQRNTFAEIVDVVVANGTPPADLGPQFFGKPVFHDGRQIPKTHLVLADVTNPEHLVRHDSTKLANAILDVYHGKRKVKNLPAGLATVTRLVS